PAPAPALLNGPDLEIAAAVAQPVAGGMLPRQHQGAVGAQHPPQFPQRADPVIDVFDRQRAQGKIDAGIGQPADPVAQVVHPEVALPDAGLADLHHARALVEPGHPGTTPDEFGGVQAGAARRVEDPLAGHVAEQGQARRAVVVGVVEAVLGVLGELIGEHVVLGIPPHPAVHAAILPSPEPAPGSLAVTPGRSAGRSATARCRRAGGGRLPPWRCPRERWRSWRCRRCGSPGGSRRSTVAGRPAGPRTPPGSPVVRRPAGRAERRAPRPAPTGPRRPRRLPRWPAPGRAGPGPPVAARARPLPRYPCPPFRPGSFLGVILVPATDITSHLRSGRPGESWW